MADIYTSAPKRHPQEEAVEHSTSQLHPSSWSSNHDLSHPGPGTDRATYSKSVISTNITIVMNKT